MCRHAVAKVRLLSESTFYLRAVYIQDFTVVGPLEMNETKILHNDPETLYPMKKILKFYT